MSRPATGYVVNPIVPCRTCGYCRHGSYRLCDRFANIGLHGNGGGFAENAVVPASNVVRLPEGFPRSSARSSNR